MQDIFGFLALACHDGTVDKGDLRSLDFIDVLQVYDVAALHTQKIGLWQPRLHLRQRAVKGVLRTPGLLQMDHNMMAKAFKVAQVIVWKSDRFPFAGAEGKKLGMGGKL